MDDRELHQKGINNLYLSHTQTQMRIKTKDDTIHRLRLEKLTQRHVEARLSKRVADNERWKIAIASSYDSGTIHRLGAYFFDAVKKRKSPGKFYQTIIDAIGDLHTIKSFTERELHISLVIIKRSGPALLFAVSKALGLPSASTVYRYLKACGTAKLRISAYGPTRESVLDKIEYNVENMVCLNLSLPSEEIVLLFWGLAFSVFVFFWSRRTKTCYSVYYPI